MASYDKYYVEEGYFGSPYPELLELFRGFDNNKTVLDLGCGQGRDALAIGKLGFRVVGVDLSKVGIDQMNEAAKSNGLDVFGLVGSYTEFPDTAKYDIILMDSMFHFYKSDVEEESKLLKDLLHKVKSGAIIVLFIQYNKSRIKVFHQAIEKSGVLVKVVEGKTFMYKKFKSEFYMCVLQKS